MKKYLADWMKKPGWLRKTLDDAVSSAADLPGWARPGNLKTLDVPAETREVSAVAEVWEVRWTSRHGAFSADTAHEAEFFLAEQTANEFATALRDAFKLTRHTGPETVVHVRKRL